MRGLQFDDPLCRCLAAEAGVAVVNVDYVVAPQHRFPAPPHQAFEVVRWVAEHGAEHGWDGDRLTVGGQSAGGGLAAAARQALEQGGPAIAVQVLHYPPLDLATRGKDKHSVIAKPMLHAEGLRYAQRLRKAGALAGHPRRTAGRPWIRHERRREGPRDLRPDRPLRQAGHPAIGTRPRLTQRVLLIRLTQK